MKLQVWKPGTQKLAQVAKSVSTQAKDKEFTLTGQPDTQIKGSQVHKTLC